MKIKTVYQIKEGTSEYAGEQVAFESPREPGIFHIPIGCTELKPPLPVAGMAIIFVNGSWDYCVDNRGVWKKQDGSIYEITEINDAPDEGWVRFSIEEKNVSEVTQEVSDEYLKIITALKDIDFRSIRPIREGNKGALQQLENEAKILRQKIKNLQAEQ